MERIVLASLKSTKMDTAVIPGSSTKSIQASAVSCEQNVEGKEDDLIRCFKEQQRCATGKNGIIQSRS